VALEPTPSQTVGPYFGLGLTNRPLANVVSPNDPGAVRISGRVVDGAGVPVDDAIVEIWQPDGEGEYRDGFGWGRCGTDADGRYSLTTVKPGSVGSQAPHLDVMVFSRGLLKPLLTRLYFPDEEEANASDPVLAGLSGDADREALVAVADGDALRYDIRLQGDRQTPFFAR
jgi:protocatechuate 3,4-dioxygenase, alpha subunit